MPRRDYLHDITKRALIKDGWQITHDPYPIAFGSQKGYVDLGAERLLGAVKGSEKIAVEVKSFVGRSLITELERALGQYLIYRTWIGHREKDRVIFLALDDEAYETLFEDISGRVLLEAFDLLLIVVDIEREEIIRWVS